MPTTPQMIANLMMTAKNVIVGMRHSTGRFLATEEMAGTRMEICSACVNFRKEAARCEICGCYMKAKMMLSEARCPIGKW